MSINMKFILELFSKIFINVLLFRRVKRSWYGDAMIMRDEDFDVLNKEINSYKPQV